MENNRKIHRQTSRKKVYYYKEYGMQKRDVL